MRRLGALVLLAGVLIAPRACRAASSLTLAVGLAPCYDDNILQYSDDQLADFASGTHPDRYSLETTDDFVLAPSLGIAWRLDQGGGRRHTLRLRGSGHFHARNGTADDRALSASWREGFRGGRAFTLSYYRLPKFYLRQLFDEDAVVPFPGLSRERRADFALGIASFDYGQRLGHKARLRVAYQYERRRYNASFPERDSNTHQAEAGVEFDRFRRRGRLELRGGWRTSDARGTDADDAPGIVPDDVDPGYHGPVAELRGGIGLNRGRHLRLDADLGYEFNARAYTSDRPADRYHFGRDDAIHAGEVGVTAAYRRKLQARAFYRLEIAHANLGTSAPASSNTGSYRERQVGLELVWTALLWRRAPRAESGDEEGDSAP